MTALRRFARANGLSLVFGGLLLLALLGESFAGLGQYNADRTTSGLPGIGYWEYVTSSSFAADVAENWQSEYLQFLLYIVATVWLVQRGAADSKPVGEEGPGSDDDEKVGRAAGERSPRLASVGGIVTGVYARSLGLVMGTIFVLSWLAQSIAGRASFNNTQLANLQAPVSWAAYVASPDFWNRTLQNWQSEFLAVGSMSVFTVFLRQRGSSESKSVGAAHDDTGSDD